MDFDTPERLVLTGGPAAYRRAGRGAMPLLLLHGWGGSSRHWQEGPGHLAGVCSLYALDLPGHGGTPARSGAIDPEDQARWVIACADRLRLERFDLDGHSWGAALAILVAAHRPERVNRLVVTSLGIARTPFERLAMTQLHHQMRLAMRVWRPWLGLSRPWLAMQRPAIDWISARPEVCRAIAGRVLRHLPADDEAVRAGVREFLSTDPLTALECVAAAGSPVFLDALGRVTAPTLVVNGDADPMMPSSGARALAARIRGARLVELQDCGHLPMVERPDAYYRLVRAFLGGEPVEARPRPGR